MTTVCQKCGVSGFEELLILCKKCQTSAEHRYCLDKMPKLGEVVHWLCEQCITSVPKVDTRKKVSERHHHPKKNLASRLQQIKYHHLENTHVGETSSNVDNPMNDTSHCLEKHVLNVGTSTKTSKSMDLEQVDMFLTSEKKGVYPEKENHEHLGNEIGQGRKVNRRRKLILDDDSDDNFIDGVPRRSSFQVNRPFSLSTLPRHSDNGTAQPDASFSKFDAEPDASLPESVADCYSHCPVNPVVHPVWRGYFNVCDRKYGPVMAHLSNRACEKVCNAADILPKVLHFKRLPRLEAWPKSFERSAPTDDNIALYFLPGDARAKAVLDQLLYDVINEDLVLRVVIGEAELLVFSSMLLPQRCHSFEGEYYLWGVFRAQQAPGPRTPRPRTPDYHSSSVIQPAGSVEEYEHCNVVKDLAASHLSRLNDGIEGSEDDDVFMGPQAPSCGIPDMFWGSQSPYEHFSKSSEVMEEPVEGTGYPFSRKEARSPCFPADKSSNFTKVTIEQDNKNSDGHMELNFSVEHGQYGDGSPAACLELFPLGVEDLAIATKVQGSDDIDLDLRLKPVKERKIKIKPTMEEHGVLLFGRVIY